MKFHEILKAWKDETWFKTKTQCHFECDTIEGTYTTIRGRIWFLIRPSIYRDSIWPLLNRIMTRPSVWLSSSLFICYYFILEKRAAEAKRILTKYPDRIPVIVEKAVRSTLPEIDKKKFLVPGSMLCGEFKYIIHKHLTQQLAGTMDALSAEQTLYLFVRNTPPRTGTYTTVLLYLDWVRCINVGALRGIQRFGRFLVYDLQCRKHVGSRGCVMRVSFPEGNKMLTSSSRL